MECAIQTGKKFARQSRAAVRELGEAEVRADLSGRQAGR
jgi:hypothetical protein